MASHNSVSLTIPQNAAIKEMASSGKRNAAIVAAIQVKKSIVTHVAEKVRSGAGSPKSDGRERPGFRDERDLRSLSHLLKANSFSSLAAITDMVHDELPKPVSARMVGHAMVKQGFHSMTPAVKTWVSDKNKANRLLCAKVLRKWGE